MAVGPAYHAVALARAGDARQAREEIARAARLDHGTSDIHHSQYYVGAAYALLGEPEQALEWLERSAAEGFPCYPFFASDPDLDRLRKDPRFQAFLAQLKTQWEGYRATL
jgi:hypothetical protein